MSKQSFSAVCVGGPRDGETMTSDSHNMNVPASEKPMNFRAPSGSLASGRMKVVSYRWVELTANVPAVWIPSGQSVGETVEKLIQCYQARGIQ